MNSRRATTSRSRCLMTPEWRPCRGERWLHGAAVDAADGFHPRGPVQAQSLKRTVEVFGRPQFSGRRPGPSTPLALARVVTQETQDHRARATTSERTGRRRDNCHQ